MSETINWNRARVCWPELDSTVLAAHNGAIFMACYTEDGWEDVLTHQPCYVTWWAYVFGPNPREA